MKIDLVPYRREYLPAFISWRQQDAMRRYNPLKPMSEGELAATLEMESADLTVPRLAYRWFVTVDGEVAGSVSLKEINRQMHYAEIGYGFDEAYHGRGIGTAAVRQAVAVILNHTNLRKLLALVHVDNVASCKLLERLGFQREGVLREHYLIDGEAVDEAMYGLLRRDFPPEGRARKQANLSV